MSSTRLALRRPHTLQDRGELLDGFGDRRVALHGLVALRGRSRPSASVGDDALQGVERQWLHRSGFHGTLRHHGLCRLGSGLLKGLTSLLGLAVCKDPGFNG